MNSRILTPFIFFLNPVYVAALSLRSLRSKKCVLHRQNCHKHESYLLWLVEPVCILDADWLYFENVIRLYGKLVEHTIYSIFHGWRYEIKNAHSVKFSLNLITWKDTNLSSFLLWRIWKLTAGINSLRAILILRESTVSISPRTILLASKIHSTENKRATLHCIMHWQAISH